MDLGTGAPQGNFVWHTWSDNKVCELATVCLPWQHWHFADIDDIWSSTTAALKAISQNQFQNYFEGCTRRWHRCIASQGEYFEGDHGGIQQ